MVKVFNSIFRKLAKTSSEPFVPGPLDIVMYRPTGYLALHR